MTDLDLDRLRSWEGREESREDVLALAPVRALAATLDHDPGAYRDGGILPPLYHWLFFLELTRSGGLARDGHPRKGEFMPPVTFPRRMFAGARIEYTGDLRIGEPVRRVSRIGSVRYTEGRSGPLVFVTVVHEIGNAHGIRLTEEQDIVYRPPTGAQAGAAEPPPVAPDMDFSRSVSPDERLLFRFSALTFNAHRIHYDLPYTRSEGYPALVVHGPLTAVLLADLLARQYDRPPLRHFSFRARNALYLGDRIRLAGRHVDDAIELAAYRDTGVAAVSGRAVLR